MDFGSLRTRFLSCASIGDIWTKDVTTESAQQDVLAATVFSEVLKGQPLSHSYTTNFMKTFMQKIEEFGGEIYDCTFEAYGDILSMSAPEVEYKHYIVRDKTISLQETNSLVADGTTGLTTWLASQYLAEYILENPSIVEGKNVLELGCGLGFLGLTLCSACRCGSYIFSDHHSSVLRKLQSNISINVDKLLCVPSVEEIDWNTMAITDASPQLNNVDSILAADVVYDCDIIPSLTKTLQKLLAWNSGRCCAYVASTIRNTDTYDTFNKTIDELGLTADLVKSSAAKIFTYGDSSDISIVCISLSERNDN